MVRPKSELVQIPVHVLLRDVDVRAAHRVLEQVPEALHVVDVMPCVRPIVVPRPFFLPMPHGAVLVALWRQ